MKKAVFVVCFIVVALLVSARWATKAVSEGPIENTLQSPMDTSLANALTIQDMVNQSDVIAIGSCVETKSVWVDRALVTLATVSVGETLKGAELGTITVELPGGVDANRAVPIAMTYPGAPSISPGENVFLFLTATGETAGSYNVAGFSQGKFSIVNNEDGESMVTRDLTKTILKDNNGVRRGQSNATPLGILKAEVKKHLGGQ